MSNHSDAATYWSVLISLLAIIFLPLFAIIVLPLCIYLGSIWRLLALSYLLYYYLDWDSINYGRDLYWVRNCKSLQLSKVYVKMTNVSDSFYPPDKNYMIGLHPHGLLTLALLRLMDDKSEEYKKMFGNAQRRFCTSNFNVYFPLQRDFFMGMGAIAASRKAIETWLNEPEGGHILDIVVGGAREASIMSEKEHRIILKSRKGFIRLALKTGAHLIPAYSFGENCLWDSYKPAPGTLIYKFQQFLLKTVGIGFPIIHRDGRYLFVMPRRGPLTTVHGPAIPVEQTDNPTMEQIDQLHEKYTKAIEELFNRYKHKYADANAKLLID